MSAQWGNLKSDRQGMRVINALRRAGCKRIEQALEMSDRTLLRISGVDPKGVKRLRQEKRTITPHSLYRLDLSYNELALLVDTLDRAPDSQECENLLNRVLNLRSVE